MPGLSRPRLRLKPLWTAELPEAAAAAAWSPDGASVAAASADGEVRLYDAADGRLLWRASGHAPPLLSLAWSSDGKSLCTTGGDGVAVLWDSASGRPMIRLDGGGGWVVRAKYSPDGAFLVTCAGKKARLWDAGECRLLWETPPHASTVSDVDWFPDGGRFATASYGGLCLYETADPVPSRKFAWKGSILTVAISPDGRYAATGDQDMSVHFWIVEEGRDLQMTGYENKPLALAWDRTGLRLATSGGRSPTVWDCSGDGPEGRMPFSPEGHGKPVTALAFQRNGDLFASAAANGEVALWGLDSVRPRAVGVSKDGVSFLSFSPDDRRLMSADDAGHVSVLGLP